MISLLGVVIAEMEQEQKRRIPKKEIAEALGVRPNTVTELLKPREYDVLDTNIVGGLMDYTGRPFEKLFSWKKKVVGQEQS